MSADVIHIAHHANPMTIYADPHFARLGSRKAEGALSYYELQLIAHRCKCSLAFLDACNSATQQNRNYQRVFRTSEHIGFVSVFLLNRRCTVVALNWATLDSVAFCASSIFYRSLHDGWCIAQSVCRTAATLYDISGAELKIICDEIRDVEVREEVKARIEKLPDTAPLRHPFFYGAYNVYELL